MKIHRSAIPSRSLARQYLPGDYHDCFSCDLSTQTHLPADDLQLAFWTDMPAWVRALFTIRNRLVRIAGIGPAGSMETFTRSYHRVIRNRERLDSLYVSDSDADETVLCLDEDHLKAFVALRIEPARGSQTLYLITVVKFRNRTGRFYFNAIRPFHKLLVRYMLRRTVRRM